MMLQFFCCLSHYTWILLNNASFPNGFLSKSDSCFVHQMALFSFHGRPKNSQAVFLSFHKRTHQVWILSGGHTDGRGCKEVSQLSLGPRHLHFRGWEETDQGPSRLTPSFPHFLWKHSYSFSICESEEREIYSCIYISQIPSTNLIILMGEKSCRLP